MKNIISISLSAIFLLSAMIAFASDDIQFNHDISGALDVQIVDGSGNNIAGPTLNFSTSSFSTTNQSTTATLGTASQKLRVTNPSGITDTWALNIAATSGSSSAWSNGTETYDFNDSTAGAGDGADVDSVGGQMTINPAAGTIAGVGSTATTNISKGTSDSFVEGSVDSIDLMTAATGADAPGQWDLTGVTLTQSIPASQASGSYAISMTLTAV